MNVMAAPCCFRILRFSLALLPGYRVAAVIDDGVDLTFSALGQMLSENASVRFELLAG